MQVFSGASHNYRRARLRQLSAPATSRNNHIILTFVAYDLQAEYGDVGKLEKLSPKIRNAESIVEHEVNRIILGDLDVRLEPFGVDEVEDIKPGSIREHEIEHDDFVLVSSEEQLRLHDVAHDVCSEIVSPNCRREELAERTIIFDDEDVDACGCRHWTETVIADE